jgi:hypothetical protein
MNPYQHGEVFVTEDGAETDLDIGHYERFMGENLDRRSNFTTGAVYQSVITMERRGDFLGKTIQIIPHVTAEIKRRIVAAGREKSAAVTLIEIGGTVGDIEAEPFLEASRQMLREEGAENVAFVHVVKMDYIFPSDEAKTKPIQQSVVQLRERGIQPDFLIVRCKRPLTKENIEKISLFTNVAPAHIIQGLNVSTIYRVPINFRKASLDTLLLERFFLHGFENGAKRRRVAGFFLCEVRFDRPECLGLECADLVLPFHDQTKRDGLNASGRKAAHDFAPQKRRKFVSDETVEDPARLLGIHQIFINGARMFERIQDRFFGDLVKNNPFGIAQA